MFSKTGLALLLLGASAVLATPTPYRLEDIQCRCLSFSTSAKPTVCTYLDFRGLDWQTAFSYASEHNLKIQFTSHDTISKVLAIPKPLPSSVLSSLGRGEALPPSSTDLTRTENKIVCGLGDEVKHISKNGLDTIPGNHCVGVVAGVLMLLVVFYAVADHVRTRCFGPAQGDIKLEGDEKTLTAESEKTSVADIS